MNVVILVDLQTGLILFRMAQPDNTDVNKIYQSRYPLYEEDPVFANRKNLNNLDNFGMQRDHPDNFNMQRYHPDNFDMQRVHPDNFNMQRDHPDNFDMQRDYPDNFNMQKDHPDNFNMQRAHPDNFNIQRDHPDNFNIQRAHPDNFNMKRAPPDDFNIQRAHPDNFNMQRAPPDNFNIQSELRKIRKDFEESQNRPMNNREGPLRNHQEYIPEDHFNRDNIQRDQIIGDRESILSGHNVDLFNIQKGQFEDDRNNMQRADLDEMVTGHTSEVRSNEKRNSIQRGKNDDRDGYYETDYNSRGQFDIEPTQRDQFSSERNSKPRGQLGKRDDSSKDRDNLQRAYSSERNSLQRVHRDDRGSREQAIPDEEPIFGKRIHMNKGADVEMNKRRIDSPKDDFYEEHKRLRSRSKSVENQTLDNFSPEPFRGDVNSEEFEQYLLKQKQERFINQQAIALHRHDSRDVSEKIRELREQRKRLLEDIPADDANAAARNLMDLREQRRKMFEDSPEDNHPSDDFIQRQSPNYRSRRPRSRSNHRSKDRRSRSRSINRSRNIRSRSRSINRSRDRRSRSRSNHSRSKNRRSRSISRDRIRQRRSNSRSWERDQYKRNKDDYGQLDSRNKDRGRPSESERFRDEQRPNSRSGGNFSQDKQSVSKRQLSPTTSHASASFANSQTSMPQTSEGLPFSQSRLPPTSSINLSISSQASNNLYRQEDAQRSPSHKRRRLSGNKGKNLVTEFLCSHLCKLVCLISL